MLIVSENNLIVNTLIVSKPSNIKALRQVVTCGILWVMSGIVSVYNL